MARGTAGAFPPDPPYVSQWGDLSCNVAVVERGEDPAPLHDWRADGYESADDYRLWSRNTCGLACLQSVLAAHPERWPRQTKGDVLRAALRWEALTVRPDGSIGGLYYAPFVRWVAHDYGLEAVSRPELPVDELARRVASGRWYAMASVSYEIRRPREAPTHTGGHLVLVFRAEGDELVFHNPSGLPGTACAARLPRDAFAAFYAGRGILVARG